MKTYLGMGRGCGVLNICTCRNSMQITRLLIKMVLVYYVNFTTSADLTLSVAYLHSIGKKAQPYHFKTKTYPL